MVNSIKTTKNMVKKADEIMCSNRQEWNRGNCNTKRLLEATIIIRHIQKMAPIHTKAAALAIRAI